ncbi:hypothetical protein BGZ99_009361 [Dissophora globulifera]|uniref:Uncharacterized protein n=1 Tax=Dissophora globulifera TaxID=979702 RepID=A0A9P6R729_9FUNG|nr:hypothetical protein BGZ99_009361 [Dissophora globulifera]
MIRILEDDPVTNAGIGSNLNLDGRVECDASIMNGTTLGFGSVGALTDFKNPISVAAKILNEADQGPLSLGRIPPIMLVGRGATQWVDTMGFSSLERVNVNPSSSTSTATSHPDNKSATANCASESMDGSLITKESLNQHIRFHSMLQRVASSATGTSESSVSSPQKTVSGSEAGRQKRQALEEESLFCGKRQELETNTDSYEDLLQDTVGAICIDSCGRVAAGVSSGGIAMKFPGRVSEAALFGAGCWAQDSCHDTDEESSASKLGFACSMTGAGEQITKTLLARMCMDTFFAQERDQRNRRDCSSGNKFKKSEQENDSGEDDVDGTEDEDLTSNAANTVLDKFIKSPLLRGYDERHAGFLAVKGVGYMSAQDTKPTTMMSERKTDSSKTVYTCMVRI